VNAGAAPAGDLGPKRRAPSIQRNARGSGTNGEPGETLAMDVMPHRIRRLQDKGLMRFRPGLYCNDRCRIRHLGGLYLLFRGEHPFDEPKKRRKQLLGSNWK
jgi:hypothetical protein